MCGMWMDRSDCSDGRGEQTGGTDLKHFQNFGYDYEELPRDIPNGEAEDYRLE